ncbi:hypothetical protein MASR1M90_23710 [Desulfovibrionales bacterium]
MEKILIVVVIILLSIKLIEIIINDRKKKADGKIFLTGPLPYVKNKYLFSIAENNFFQCLQKSMPDNFLAVPKVRIADVLSVGKGVGRNNFNKYFNKISGKHFDYIILNKNGYVIYAAIELDDSSHDKESRTERDSFVEKACIDAELKLIRFKVQQSYIIQEIRSKIFANEETKIEKLQEKLD